MIIYGKLNEDIRKLKVQDQFQDIREKLNYEKKLEFIQKIEIYSGLCFIEQSLKTDLCDKIIEMIEIEEASGLLLTNENILTEYLLMREYLRRDLGET